MAQWVLGQVCRSWRAVALATTDLWTKIDLSWTRTPSNISPERALLLEPVLALQLQRCRERPITFSYRSDEDRKERLALLLCSRSLQWENVSIVGESRAFAPLRQYHGLFPLLKTLHVGFLEDNWAGDSVLSAFDKLSSLEHLVIAGEAQPLIRQGNQFSWEAILHYTTVHANGWIPDLADHYRVLPRLVNVQTCVLDTCFPDVPTADLPPSPTLELSFLHTLVLKQTAMLSMPAIAPLLRWLVLPALRILRLPSGFNCPATLASFLNRFHCSLEELTILNMEDWVLNGVAVDDLIRVLKAPSLHTIYVGHRCLGIGPGG
ncbi:hypothetical protein AAF712_009268 [Marasmius tenuissimus]|uniref:F-box domain-containing protein n=1 Tax=Marasmius tenuissimus TaxID=585030 RepID=A0ABR2ZR30_9AGAR